MEEERLRSQKQEHSLVEHSSEGDSSEGSDMDQLLDEIKKLVALCTVNRNTEIEIKDSVLRVQQLAREFRKVPSERSNLREKVESVLKSGSPQDLNEIIELKLPLEVYQNVKVIVCSLLRGDPSE